MWATPRLWKSTAPTVDLSHEGCHLGGSIIFCLSKQCSHYWQGFMIIRWSYQGQDKQSQISSICWEVCSSHVITRSTKLRICKTNVSNNAPLWLKTRRATKRKNQKLKSFVKKCLWWNSKYRLDRQGNNGTNRDSDIKAKIEVGRSYPKETG